VKPLFEYKIVTIDHVRHLQVSYLSYKSGSGKADAPTSGKAWLLSLTDEWNPCRVENTQVGGPL
jgi:hypothetical protein